MYIMHMVKVQTYVIQVLAMCEYIQDLVRTNLTNTQLFHENQYNLVTDMIRNVAQKM